MCLIKRTFTAKPFLVIFSVGINIEYRRAEFLTMEEALSFFDTQKSRIWKLYPTMRKCISAFENRNIIANAWEPGQ